MTFSFKKILFPLILTLLLGITNSYSQSENEKIHTLIEQKRAFNKKNKSSIVYKIQLYNGNETQANSIKKKFKNSFPEYHVFLYYKAPEWKTQVGNFQTRYFQTRLEADRILNIIKEKFTGAIVLETKI